MPRPRLIHLLLMFVFCLSLIPSQAPVSAAGVVGNGTPASCSYAAFTAALSGGGLVTFNCGPNPHTILLTGSAANTLTANTTIDGGGLITLDAQHLRRHFIVNAGVTLNLSNITLNRAKVFTTGASGAAIYNFGTVNLVNVVIRDAIVTTGYGGALYNNQGTVTALNSQFLNNSTGLGSDAGGALLNDNGVMTLDSVLLQGNTSAYGGAISSVGSLTIRNSTLTQNRAITAVGGALTVGGTIIITNTQISENMAVSGGAINITSAGNLTVEDSLVARNQVSVNGGGFYNAGTLTIRRTTLEANSAANGGGLYDNSTNKTTTITESLFKDNTATNSGGGVFKTNTTMVIANTTFNGNQVSGFNSGGALLSQYGNLSLSFVTFAGNLAFFGGGVATTDTAWATVLEGVVFANNPANNCDKHSVFTWNGVNLSDDASCYTASATRLIALPQLGDLADNGGPTLSHLPQPGSPVIDAGGQSCPASDQRGVARPLYAGCDLGAMEVSPSIPVCGGVFPAIADASTNSAAPNTNYGGQNTLQVSLDAARDQRSLLAFDISELGSQALHISQATLELPIAAANNLPSGDLIEVMSLANAWDENSVTYNTAPAGMVSFSRGGTVLDDNILRIDLTPLVIHWHNGQIGEHSLNLLAAGEGLDLALKSRESGDGARLVIDCSPLPQPYPGDSQAASAAQEAGRQRLAANSSTPLLILGEAGAVEYAEFDLQAPASVSNDPLDKAEWFIQEYADLLGTTSNDFTWQFKRRSEDGLRLFFRPLYQGVPLYPAELAVQTDATGQLTGLGGSYRTQIDLPTSPLLTGALAETLARTALDPASEVHGETQLRFFLPDLAGGGTAGIPATPDTAAEATDESPARERRQQAARLAYLPQTAAEQPAFLAWEVNLNGPAGKQTAFIDANSGQLLFHERHSDLRFDLDIEDANFRTPEEICRDDQNDNMDPGADADALAVSYGMRTTYYWFANVFGRDSYDGDGEQIEAMIHANFPLNAAYTGCDVFVFGEGVVDMDTVAHEFTHGLVNSEYSPGYSGQSGALNESLADMFAAFIDIDTNTPGEPPDGNWKLFEEDPVTGALRDMSHPPAHSECGVKHPDKMRDYRNTTCDDGGVHINNGITNKFLYLIAQDGTKSHNGQQVKGISLPKARQLIYNVVVNRLGDNANFTDFARQTTHLAREWGQQGYFSTSDVCQVLRAFAAVELGGGDLDCNGVEDSSQDPDGDKVYNSRPNGVIWDNCPNSPNPFQEDKDKDGIGDACDFDRDGDGTPDATDNCPDIRNNQADNIDNDYLGDACDDNKDGDRWPDARDNCPLSYQEDQADVDRDRVGDTCDLDSDNDRICNRSGPLPGGKRGVPILGCGTGAGLFLFNFILLPADNCPLDRNPLQEDSDKDYVGDACDLCPGIRTSDNGDPDGDKRGNGCDDDDDNDGVLDYNPDGSQLDNCREVANPEQHDFNHNGIGFECDPLEKDRLRRGLEQLGGLRFLPESVLRFPVPVCPGCVARSLPYNFQNIVNIQLDLNAKVRIVDSRGLTVAKGQVQSGQLRLNFRPPAYAVPPLMAPDLPPALRSLSSDLAQTSSQASLAPDESIYYLEITPPEGADLSQEYPFSMTIESAIVPPSSPLSMVYIPMVSR